ncbi:lactadherin-like [Diadema setosum]|uniref:lactadherin-like n=1 Tax=Diadema setosum TaxID=31175 RepID=UPI003B3B7989
MGRLDSLQGDGKGGSWTARANDGNQWIKVDFRRMYHVTGITTQGRPESDQWVTEFKIAYSPDGITWSFVKDCADNDKRFVANSDPDTKVKNSLVEPIRAQLLRIHPTAWHERISMTFEVFGIGPVPGQRFDPLELGMQDRRITDSRLSASSCYNDSTCASHARLGQKPDSNGIGAWSAGVLDHTQWIQVDLTDNRLIQGVVTQGRYDVDQWVSSFKMTYKQDGDRRFQDVLDTSGVPQVFVANEDRNSYAVNTIAVPVTARFVRIHPASWVGHISMRFELFGLNPGSEQQTPGKLGIADGRVSSTSLVASSCRDMAHCADHSRLNRRQIGNVGGAWIAGSSREDEWIQVDLRSAFEITGVTTQGRHDAQHDEWVTSYTVWYSIDGKDWTAVTDCSPQPKTFPANFDKESTVHNAVSPPFAARFVRLQPVSWNNAISLRWELVGKGPVIRENSFFY